MLLTLLKLPKLFDGKEGLEKESSYEGFYLDRLDVSMKQMMKTKKGKRLSRSLSSQKTKWVNHDLVNFKDDETTGIFLFSNLKGAITRFREYISDKYSGNDAKSKEEYSKWNHIFQDVDLVDDIETVVVSAIYEYKYRRLYEGHNLFLNPVANRSYQKVDYDRSNEVASIKAVSVGRKNIDSSMSVEQEEEFDKLFIKKMKPVYLENLPEPLICIGQNREFVTQLIKLEGIGV